MANKLIGLTDNIQTQLNAKGAGNVVGPASATTGNLAVFADETGEVIVDGGAIPSGGGGGLASPLIANLSADNHSLTLVKLLTLHGEIDDGNSGVALTLSWSSGMAHKSTLTGNVTLAFTGITNNSIGATAVASVDNGGQYGATRAIDGDLGTHYECGTSPPWWFSVQLPSAVVVESYVLAALASYRPTTWTLKGSNDGTSWSNALDTQTNNGILSDQALHTFSIASPASYLYYRLDVTAQVDGFAVLVEFQLLTGFTNPATPCFLTLKLVQDATGGRTVTWPATVRGTVTVNTNVNGVTIVQFYWDGTNYYVVNVTAWTP